MNSDLAGWTRDLYAAQLPADHEEQRLHVDRWCNALKRIF